MKITKLVFCQKLPRRRSLSHWLSSQATVAAQDADAPERSIEGVWRVTVTPRNCVTGVPIATADFEALYTFHKDGTMSAWFQNSTITTYAQSQSRTVEARRGLEHYSFKFVYTYAIT